jgi:hypothetical protein
MASSTVGLLIGPRERELLRAARSAQPQRQTGTWLKATDARCRQLQRLSNLKTTCVKGSGLQMLT